MRYEAKTLEEAIEGAARALGKPAGSFPYVVIRDEKSFWGGRVVEIEVEGQEAGNREAGNREAGGRRPDAGPEHETARDAGVFEAAVSAPPAAKPEATGEPWDRNAPGATDAEAVALVESTLTELLSAAGLLVEIRRRESASDELLFELIGDDVEPLLASQGEGLTGLEVLVGRIAAKRLGRPVHPRLDADGFRAHRKESLEELARQSAEEVRRSRRPTLLPPLSPWERRLVHMALSEDAEVETQSEGEGFLKRVEVRLKSR